MSRVSLTTLREQILAGRAPAGIKVKGTLDLSDCAISALPPGLRVERLCLNGCVTLTALPAGLVCDELEMRGTGVRTLPADLQVHYLLDVSDNAGLAALPAGLRVGTLLARNCPSLTALPGGLAVYELDLSGCVRFAGWPAAPITGLGRLLLRECPAVTALPAWMTNLWALDVRGCPNLRALPPGLWAAEVDLADTAITALPASLANAQMRWRGVAVAARVVFAPETITAAEILADRNTERRRVLVERMGTEAFLAEAQGEVLDQDTDMGGVRRLIRVPLANDEPLVCVAVFCPSTGHQYMLRVPPTLQSCRQGVAWLAGFDNPDDYQPVVEA